MTKTALLFGDSNTHGTKPMVTHADLERFDRATRWPGVAAAALGGAWHLIEEGQPGRTTLHDDPIEGPHRNGSSVLPALLETHRPLDLVVIMLGTNDLKPRFSMTAKDISLGIDKLAKIIQASNAGPKGAAPGTMIVAPLMITETGCLAEIFEGGAEKSRRLPGYYETVATNLNMQFLDANAVASVDPTDGVHLNEAAHKAIGLAVAQSIQSFQDTL